MAAPTIIGTQVVWGTSETTTYGLIQSMTTGKGGQQKEYKNYQGETVTLVTYDKHDTCSVTAICVGSAPTLPEVGETFTIGNTTYRVTGEPQINWSNEDAANVTLAGRTYPTISTTTTTTTP